MSDIHRIYTHEREALQSLLSQVLHELDALRYNRGLSNIHSIKGRVKSVGGVVDKMKRKSDMDRWSPKPSIYDISEVVTDIVGARIICIFRDEVTQIAELLKSDEQLPFKMVEFEEWVWGREWATAQLTLDGKDKTQHQNKKLKLSGYTSVHFVFEPRCPPFDTRFKNLRFEVQVRTILEEAWAEAEHMTAYKKYASSDVRHQFQILSDQMHAVEQLMSFVYRQIQGELRAQEVQYQLHIARSYESQTPPLPNPLLKLWREAYQERSRGNHLAALRIHRQMIEEEKYATQFPDRASLNEVVCELGFDHLLIGDHDSLEKAYDLYQGRALQEEPDNFWANFRLSYIFYHRGLFHEAITACERALNILEERGGCIPRYDCTGLLADAKAYLGDCYWQLALTDYKNDNLTSAEFFHKGAIQQTEEGLTYAMNDKDVQESQRCRNNLSFLYIQLGDEVSMTRASQLLASLDVGHNPLYLTTKALYLFRLGDKQEATTIMQRAWDMLRKTRNAVPYAVSNRVKQYLYLLMDDYNGIQPFEFKEFH